MATLSTEVCAMRGQYKDTQELYEHIREYFARPDAVIAIDEETGACQYRARVEGKDYGCAIGCAIPDAMLFDPTSSLDSYENASTIPLIDIESLGADEVIDRYDELKRLFQNCDLSFVNRAQLAHDSSKTAAEMLMKLDDVAAEDGLKVEGR